MYFFYYLPIGLHSTARRFPVMAVIYSLICVVIFVCARFLDGLTAFDVYNLMYVPASGQYLQTITAAFLHLGFTHIAGNLLYLLFFGRYVEDRMGPVLFTVIFLTSAAVGNIAQGAFNIHVLDEAGLGIIGASGAVSGMLGAFLVRFPTAKMQIAYWAFMPLQAFTRAGRVEVPAIFAIVLWFLVQVSRSLIQLEGAGTQVAYINHVAGFLWGATLATLAGQYRAGRIEALLERGNAYLRKGRVYAAQDAYIRYLSVRPDEPAVYASLARAMVVARNREGANKNYRRACQMLIDGGNVAKAESIFIEAMRGDEKFTLDAEYQLKIAFGLERDLKARAAVNAYQRFERRYPLHSEAPFALLRAAGLYWQTLDEPFRARDCFERLVEEYPDDRWVDYAKDQLRRIALVTDPAF